jgi:hypothetical protein
LRTKAFRAAAEHDLSFYDQFSSGHICAAHWFLLLLSMDDPHGSIVCK